MIALKARNASLTEAESGKSFATSGSSSTRLVPLLKRAAYGFRRAVLKSYSGRISSSSASRTVSGLSERFFMGLLLCARYGTSTDYANSIFLLGKHYSNQPAVVSHSDQNEPVLQASYEDHRENQGAKRSSHLLTNS